MSLYIDKKYANLISSKLPLFKWNSDKLANFRCPLCGDSKKHKRKKRAFLYETDKGLGFTCHNCGLSHSFNFFLKLVDKNLYKQYVVENFSNTKKTGWDITAPTKVLEKQDSSDPLSKLKSIAELNQLNILHPAVKYIKDRKIPHKYWSKLYYTNNFKKWVNENVTANKFVNTEKDDERIVIPFFGKQGKALAYQGRYIGSNKKEEQRYITINPTKITLLYNMDNVDITKPIPLVEGPFDSMFLDNALAAAGSALTKMITSKLNTIFIFDNEPRNKEICEIMLQVIDAGKKIVIWPKNLKEKDINDMILNKLDVEKIIKNNTCNGLEAMLRYKEWRKI